MELSISSTLKKSAAEKSSHVLIYLNTLVDELKEEYPGMALSTRIWATEISNIVSILRP